MTNIQSEITLYYFTLFSENCVKVKQQKCEHCNEWTDGEQEKCLHCDHILNLRDKQEYEVLKKAKGMSFPLIQIKENDSLPLKASKHLIRVGQLIFFAVISFIAAMASSTVH